MNETSLIGNLTKDPEQYNSIVSFNLAVSRDYADKDGNYGTDFIPVKCFGKTGERVLKRAKKGNKLALTGHIEVYNSQQDDGSVRIYTSVIADKVWFFDKKEKEPEPTSYKDVKFNDNDLPF